MPPSNTAVRSSPRTPRSSQRSVRAASVNRKLLGVRDDIHDPATPSTRSRNTPVLTSSRSSRQSLRRGRGIESHSESELEPEREPEPGTGYDDDDDDHGDPYREALSAARDEFIHKDPDFVVKYEGIDTQTVNIEGDKLADLEFEFWDKNSGKGFWTLELGGMRYVVKYFANGGTKRGPNYRAWIPGEKGFENDAIAHPRKVQDSISFEPKKSPRRIQRPSSIAASDYEDWDEADTKPTRSLRDRSRSQLMPYTAEKAHHKRAMQGIAKRGVNDFDFFPPNGMAGRIFKEHISVKKRRTSSRSDSLSGTQGAVAEKTIQEKTVFYTKLSTETNQASEIVCLRDTLTIEALFTEIREACKRELGDSQIAKLSVTFPWLETNDTISVREDRLVSFNRLLEEIHRAPCWKEGVGAECLVNIVAIVSTD